MSQVLTTFGVDWRLLLINAANFAILVGVLWYFLYTPLTTMLETRRQKVAQGVKDAEAAEKTRKEIEHSRAALLAEAGKEADETLAQAKRAAGAKEKEILANAEAAAARALSEAEAQAKELKAEALAESRQEVAKLVVLGIEKAMQK